MKSCIIRDWLLDVRFIQTEVTHYQDTVYIFIMRSLFTNGTFAGVSERMIIELRSYPPNERWK